MKKLLSLVLTLALLLSFGGSAWALNFTGELGNAATFETLAEAHANAPAVVNGIFGNERSTFAGHPALDVYPENTTFVYRSPNQYAGRAAARLNSNIFVYVDQHFADKDAAFAYLKDAGLIDIIDEAVGSLVLVTPIGEAFDLVDVNPYYNLQTAMLAQKATGTDAEGNRVSYADAEYFGGYGYVYFIGVNGGATFFNNYIAPEIDFVGRIAGALLVGGEMQKTRQPAVFVPIYLVDAKDDVIAKYKAINTVDASLVTAEANTYYNQAWPLRKVIVANQAATLAEYVNAAYYGMFIKAMRVPVITQGVYSGGTAFHGYNFDEAPYSLCDRSTLIDGVTEAGVYIINHQMDDNRFEEFKMPNGEFLDVWYEYLPEEVLNNTAPAGTIPLILANHGGGDDPRVFVEEFGLLELADKERVALVAADHSTIAAVRNDAFTALVHYMLDTYPALDASRVYATGYSMGGGATYSIAYANPTLFAAIGPSAGSATPITDEQRANFDGIELPAVLTISAFDNPGRRLEAVEGNPNEAEQGMIKTWTELNGIETADFDFEKYPNFGLEADRLVTDTVNDEFGKRTWYLDNADGEQRFAFIYVDDMIHALYPEYAFMIWDFMKDYSRNLETNEIIYNPNF